MNKDLLELKTLTLVDCNRVVIMAKELFPDYDFDIHYSSDSWIDEDFIMINKSSSTKTNCISMYQMCTSIIFKELINRSSYCDEATYFVNEGYFGENYVDKLYELYLNVIYT